MTSFPCKKNLVGTFLGSAIDELQEKSSLNWKRLSSIPYGAPLSMMPSFFVVRPLVRKVIFVSVIVSLSVLFAIDLVCCRHGLLSAWFAVDLVCCRSCLLSVCLADGL